MPHTLLSTIGYIIAGWRLNYCYFFLIPGNTGNKHSKTACFYFKSDYNIFFKASTRKFLEPNALKINPINLVVSCVWLCFLCGESLNKCPTKQVTDIKKSLLKCWLNVKTWKIWRNTLNRTHQKSYSDELQDFWANRSIFFLPTKLKEQSDSSMCSSFIHSWSNFIEWIVAYGIATGSALLLLLIHVTFRGRGSPQEFLHGQFLPPLR